MIKVCADCWVSAEEIAEIKVNSSAHTITVRTKSGIGHNYEIPYGKGLYQAADDLVAEVNTSRACAFGG